MIQERAALGRGSQANAVFELASGRLLPAPPNLLSTLGLMLSARPGTPASPRHAPGLRRSLTLGDLVAIGLNATVGSGIFLLPDDLFREMGVWSPLAFALCGIGLLPVAWCYADAARRTDLTGGPYRYARERFGHVFGFSVGWMCFVNAVFSFAAVAGAAAAYSARPLPAGIPGLGPSSTALLVIGFFGALNLLGARPGASAVRLLTAGKFVVLFLLVLVLLPDLELPKPQSPPSSGWRGVASATFMALFALQGFEVVPVPAGETRDPERRVPRAVLMTLFSAVLLYVGIQQVLVLGFSDLSEPSDAPLADAALAVTPALGLVVTFGALVSTLGFVSGSALGTPRYLYAIAADGDLPRGLTRLHPRSGAPHWAIVATSAVAGGLVCSLDYRSLIGMSNVAVAVQYGATCAAVLRYGCSSPDRAGRRWRIGVSLLGLLSSGAIWFAATPSELMFAAIALSVGIAAVPATRWLERVGFG